MYTIFGDYTFPRQAGIASINKKIIICVPEILFLSTFDKKKALHKIWMEMSWSNNEIFTVYAIYFCIETVFK